MVCFHHIEEGVQSLTEIISMGNETSFITLNNAISCILGECFIVSKRPYFFLSCHVTTGWHNFLKHLVPVVKMYWSCLACRILLPIIHFEEGEKKLIIQLLSARRLETEQSDRLHVSRRVQAGK